MKKASSLLSLVFHISVKLAYSTEHQLTIACRASSFWP